MERAYRSPTRFAFNIRWNDRSINLAANRWILLAVGIALPVLGVWYLGATLYLVFHDQLLATLMTRQTDMQYAYEDRIAALRTQLDRETSRGLVDRHTLATKLQDLGIRGARLEERAATLNQLVAKALAVPSAAEQRGVPTQYRGPGADDAGPMLAPAPRLDLPNSGASTLGPLDPEASPLRLDHSSDSSARVVAPASESASLQLDDQTGRIEALFTKVERHQADAVGRLRDPMLRKVQKMRVALAEAGVPDRATMPIGAAGTGGPFVPLPEPSTHLDFESSAALLQDALRQQQRLSEIISRVPLRKPLNGALEVTSTFGARLDPFLGRPAMHTGIDLRDDSGDEVKATASGVVTIAGRDGGYGNMVEIDHGHGLATRYAHLSSIEVAPNQKVAVGAIVGHVGSTGRSTGPHLHYETRINGEAVDPSRFLRAGNGLFPG